MSCLQPFLSYNPNVHSNAYINPFAVIYGQVTIEENSNIWPYVVIRGDINTVHIGKNSNIQDSSVIHVSRKSELHPKGFPTFIGDNVTIGHKCLLHGCHIQDNVFIGMNTTILDGAIIESHVMIGANSFITGNKVLESNYLYYGNPVKKNQITYRRRTITYTTIGY